MRCLAEIQQAARLTIPSMRIQLPNAVYTDPDHVKSLLVEFYLGLKGTYEFNLRMLEK